MCDIIPGLQSITPCSSQPLDLHISAAQISPLCGCPHLSTEHLFTKLSVTKVEIRKQERGALKRDELTITEGWIKDYDHWTFRVSIRSWTWIWKIQSFKLATRRCTIMAISQWQREKVGKKEKFQKSFQDSLFLSFCWVMVITLCHCHQDVQLLLTVVQGRILERFLSQLYKVEYWLLGCQSYRKHFFPNNSRQMYWSSVTQMCQSWRPLSNVAVHLQMCTHTEILFIGSHMCVWESGTLLDTSSTLSGKGDKGFIEEIKEEYCYAKQWCIIIIKEIKKV